MATVAHPSAKPPRRWMIWTGRVLSAIPVLLLAVTSSFSLAHTPSVAAGMKQYGYPEGKLTVIASLALGSAIIYTVPRTAVLGAILMTAYFGGAVATHVRISDPGYPLAILMAVLVWLGLYLREDRLRTLVPLRRRQQP